MHRTPFALLFALARAGKSRPARMAMMAMTTSNSISVKPSRRRVFGAPESVRLDVVIKGTRLSAFLQPKARFIGPLAPKPRTAALRATVLNPRKTEGPGALIQIHLNGR